MTTEMKNHERIFAGKDTKRTPTSAPSVQLISQQLLQSIINLSHQSVINLFAIRSFPSKTHQANVYPRSPDTPFNYPPSNPSPAIAPRCRRKPDCSPYASPLHGRVNHKQSRLPQPAHRREPETKGARGSRLDRSETRQTRPRSHRICIALANHRRAERRRTN